MGSPACARCSIMLPRNDADENAAWTRGPWGPRARFNWGIEAEAKVVRVKHLDSRCGWLVSSFSFCFLSSLIELVTCLLLTLLLPPYCLGNMLLDAVRYVTSKLGKSISLGRQDALRTPGHVQKCWYEVPKSRFQIWPACQYRGAVPVEGKLDAYLSKKPFKRQKGASPLAYVLIISMNVVVTRTKFRNWHRISPIGKMGFCVDISMTRRLEENNRNGEYTEITEMAAHCARSHSLRVFQHQSEYYYHPIEAIGWGK